MTSESKPIVNFGNNVSFRPRVVVAPRTEEEVLQALEQYSGSNVRVMGRLHSWSEAPRGDDVLLDLRHMNSVVTEPRDGRIWATLEAGCQIKRALAELERQAGATLPSVGLISEQAIAGAISTGTHGSGKNSLSHYVAEVRVATYDPETGAPTIRTMPEGPELRAARCSLGCLGIILSIGLWVRPQYRVEEHFHRHATLGEVMEAERDYPLQQFYVIPWSWDFWGHHRHEVAGPRSWLAPLYRLYFWLTFDIGLHLNLQLLVKLIPSRRGIKLFFRRIMPWTVIQNWKVVDKSFDMLIMEHELFRHIEVEIFVKRSRLPATIGLCIELLQHFDGRLDALSSETQAVLQREGLIESLIPCAGSYTHHYPICIRRILPDETLLSMASGEDEDYYSLSFISYARPTERQGFFKFADYLVKATSVLFQARPHWGKYCPIDAKSVAALYPHLSEFHEVCLKLDPQGRFVNEWTSRLFFSRRPS